MRLYIMRTLGVSMLTGVLLLAGCAAQGSQAGTANSAQAASAQASAAASQAATSSAQPSSPTPKPSEKPKNATWVVDVNDTQKYTDEMGIVWNYTLTFHASKPGGTNVTGEFTGDANLKIEPDIATVKAAAASEGTQLLSMVFNYHAECKSLSFVVEKFTAPQTDKDNPLAPLVNTDFSAKSSAVFAGTQEPISMTIMHDGSPKSGSGGGGGATVNVPFTVEIDGASARIKFSSLPQPLEAYFKGVVTGDVLPG